MDVDEFRQAGLYDPAAPDADNRLALLRLLADEGATIEEMQAALAEERLIGLAVDAVVRPAGERMTFGGMCERAGLDTDRGTVLLRAAGFPRPDAEDRVFTEADARCYAFLALLLEGDPAPGVQIARAAGAAMSSLAEAELAAVRSSIEGPMRAAGVGDFEQAQSYRAVAGVLPEILHMLDVFHRRHLLAGMRTRVFWEAGRPNVDAVVGFADVVGYTTHVQALDVPDLAAVVDRFETAARAVISDAGGRLVKLIGDEVMFQAATADAGCRIAADLRSTFATDPALPQLRVGLAMGRMLAFEGDYYGRPVNIAARLAKEADAGSVLVTGEIREAVVDGFIFETAGERTLKGIGAIDTYRLVAG